MRKITVLGLTVMVLLCLAGTASALTVTHYTNKAAWESACGGQFLTEDFTDKNLNPGVSYTSSESGHINVKFGYYHDVLTSESANAPMTTWYFTPQITAYGGNWTLGGPGGSGNSLLVYVNDLSHYVGYISNAYNGGFWGFTSDTPFTSVILKGATGLHQQGYQLDDMVYAQVPVFMPLSGPVSSPVPVPGTVWLMGGGLIGLLARLRRVA